MSQFLKFTRLHGDSKIAPFVSSVGYCYRSLLLSVIW